MVVDGEDDLFIVENNAPPVLCICCRNAVEKD